MAGTFSRLLYHVVFSTKNRVPLSDPNLRTELYPYMEGIIRQKEVGSSRSGASRITSRLPRLRRWRETSRPPPGGSGGVGAAVLGLSPQAIQISPLRGELRGDANRVASDMLLDSGRSRWTEVWRP